MGAPLRALFALDERTARRTLEFFTATIRNPHTSRTYGRAVAGFAAWCGLYDLHELHRIEPVHGAAWIEDLGRGLAAPSVKQQLAAVRMLFDWLVVGQIVATNPASAGRGPKRVVKKGKAPVLAADEARALLDSIDTTTPVGLRDRALIVLMTYTFARVGARREDARRRYLRAGQRHLGPAAREGRQAPRHAGPP